VGLRWAGGVEVKRWLESLAVAMFGARRQGVGGRSCCGEARARSSVPFYGPRRRRGVVREVVVAGGGGFQWGQLRGGEMRETE
jgi:hypothetical protein